MTDLVNDRAYTQQYGDQVSNNPMVDMAHPSVLDAFPRSGGSEQPDVSVNGQLIFDNPYGDNEDLGWHSQRQGGDAGRQAGHGDTIGRDTPSPSANTDLSTTVGGADSGPTGSTSVTPLCDTATTIAGSDSAASTNQATSSNTSLDQQILATLGQIENELLQVTELLNTELSGASAGSGSSGDTPASGGQSTSSAGGDATSPGSSTAPTDTTPTPGTITAPTDTTPTPAPNQSGETSDSQINLQAFPGAPTPANDPAMAAPVTENSTLDTPLISGQPANDTTTGLDYAPTDVNGTSAIASLTDVASNNGAVVAPSFYAQSIASNATYVPANLPETSFDTFDVGAFIDEQGMTAAQQAAQLQTIPVYQIDQSNWNDNATTGQQIGTVQIPDGMELLRQPTVWSGGEANGNSSVTIVAPDGEQQNFNKTYIGPDPALTGNDTSIVMIAGPYGHGGSNESTAADISQQEATAAVNSGTEIPHALGIVLPNDDESSSGSGFVYPATSADSGYQGAYTGSNPNVQMGTHLAVPEGITAQQLGLQTAAGDAILATMEQYGGYVNDSNGTGAGIDIDTDPGAGQILMGQQDSSMPSSNSAFDQDMQKIMSAAEVVLPSS